MGIEPTCSAWKADVLPLNYTRLCQPSTYTLLFWWRGEDSNLRRMNRQIYSLIPLATREPLQKCKRLILLMKGLLVNTIVKQSDENCDFFLKKHFSTSSNEVH